MRLRACLLVFAMTFGAAFGGATTDAVAQAATTGSIVGTLTSPDGLKIAGAAITLAGPTTLTAQSDATGQFILQGIQPGIYSLNITKAAFVPTDRTNIVVVAGSQQQIAITLQATSFSELRTIGSVTTSQGRIAMNTTPASIVSIPASTFIDQGVQQVTSVLNQIPGLTMTIPASSTNISGASAITPQIPQIRGALPYETESLIDGHPISVGAYGYFTPLFVNPNQLQEVEVAKGPGSTPTDISYSVGGSVNYVTLQPTATPHEMISFDQDSYGGLSTNLRATGSALNGHLGYAVAAGIDGTPGALASVPPVAGVPIEAIVGTSTANGVPLCGSFSNFSECIEGNAPTPPGYYSTFSPTYAITTCCYQLSSQYLARSELAKLRYNFSTQSSLTIAYLGGQSTAADEQNYTDPQQLFVAPAGYSGSIPSGTSLPYATDTYSAWTNHATQGLLESEFRTSVGPGSLLFRYYTGANDNVLVIGNPNNVPFVFTANTWGGLPIGPGGAMEYFNGTPVNYSAVDSGLYEVNLDNFNGLSGEYDLPVGNNTYTVSADRTSHQSYSAYLFQGQPLDNDDYPIPYGASQAITTYLARGQFALAPKVNATLANYFVNYQTHYTPDGGVTWGDASHSFYGPRASFTWHPTGDTNLRFAAGSSIAPPYLALVNTEGGPPQPNINGAPTYYSQTVNTGNVSPETAFGYDLGIDQRIQRDTVLTSDIYLTTLHGQFLTSVTANGTYTGTGDNLGLTAPLYVTSTENLGTSRYEGFELAVHKVPTTGLGYTVQGSLERAYTYNLPVGFYNTANGPLTTNLAVIPNVNFEPGGEAFNGIGTGRTPYASGYAELNYKTKSGSLFLIGTQYNGNNNTYNLPAFFTVNASARFQLGKTTSIQVSGANLTGAYSSRFFGLQDGIPVPLVNGLLGALPSINVGPATFHFVLTEKFGQ
jgi:outer membrane receptor protein involved in Fe transport